VSLDNGSTWATATSSVGSNTWSIGVTLTASNTLKARVSNASTTGAALSQAYVLDTTAPTVSNVTATNANAAYTVGANIVPTVQFTEPIFVNTGAGTPALALNSGGSGSYTSVSGGNTMLFGYTVAAGQNSPDLDYASTAALIP